MIRDGFPAMTIRGSFIVVLLAALTAGPALAGDSCHIDRMMKVVFQDATPGHPPSWFGYTTLTLYKSGDYLGRFEEELDPAMNIHGLSVTNNRDTWMVERVSKTGKHVVDTAESYLFRVPLFAASEEDLKTWAGLEFGCEFAYMSAKGSQDWKARSIDGKSVDQYHTGGDSDKVVIQFLSGTGEPTLAERYMDGKLVQRTKYLEYRLDLPPQFELFQKPEGIQYREYQ